MRNNNAVAGADQQADDVTLQLNGHDRFKTRNAAYFSVVQRYQHHSGCGGLQTKQVSQDANATIVPAQTAVPSNIQVYSFALKPEEHQPSGTCNFSRIDNAVLNYTAPDTCDAIQIYAVNYNVLRVMSGMGGLAYSN